ncbi:MAG: NADH-quinone oxidoreductase subunit J [Actinomycetota bacterium]|nr:NADH-quinone oxidoreductase subunit J [Actinomycetota bacterium]
MTVSISEFFRETANWAFLVIAVPTLYAGWRTVTSNNIVRAVLYLVVSLGGTAALFFMLGAEFVGWTVVLVYIGAVIILFLIGIMITRAPLGVEADLSHDRSVKAPAALLSTVMFGVVTWALLDAFSNEAIAPFDSTSTTELGLLIFDRFVIPFEVVSFVLLAALIGGIALARMDSEAPE